MLKFGKHSIWDQGWPGPGDHWASGHVGLSLSTSRSQWGIVAVCHSHFQLCFMKRSYAHTYILALIFFSYFITHTELNCMFVCVPPFILSFMCCVLFEGIWLQMQELETQHVCLFHCYSSFSCFLPLFFFYSFGFFCLLLTWPSPPVCFTIISTQIII